MHEVDISVTKFLISIGSKNSLSLHTILVAHQAGVYPGFHDMKQLGVFLLLPGWDASPSQGYPQHFAGTHLYTWVERGTMRLRVKCFAQENNELPRPVLKPGLPDLLSSALTIRPTIFHVIGTRPYGCPITTVQLQLLVIGYL